MIIPDMSFTPSMGLQDPTYSPQVPNSESDIRGQIQGVSNQLRDYINSTLKPLMVAGNIPATPINVNSGSNVQDQLAWLLTQIAIASTGALIDGSITEAKLNILLLAKINTALSNTGLLTTLITTDKSSLVNAVDEVVTNLSAHLAEIVTVATPNEIPRALATGILDPGWMPRSMPNMQIFEANGTFTVPQNITEIFVEVVGGGGGGRSAYGNGWNNSHAAGGGGYACKKINNLVSLSTVAVTVGLGGTGGVATTTAVTEGTTGGTSSFGSYISATGGASTAIGGLGVGGDLNIKGGTGCASAGGASNSTGSGGTGGGSIYGAGGVGNTVGGNGYQYGGGGGNGYGYFSGIGYSGGSGASGIVIVRW